MLLARILYVVSWALTILWSLCLLAVVIGYDGSQAAKGLLWVFGGLLALGGIWPLWLTRRRLQFLKGRSSTPSMLHALNRLLREHETRRNRATGPAETAASATAASTRAAGTGRAQAAAASDEGRVTCTVEVVTNLSDSPQRGAGSARTVTCPGCGAVNTGRGATECAYCGNPLA